MTSGSIDWFREPLPCVRLENGAAKYTIFIAVIADVVLKLVDNTRLYSRPPPLPAIEWPKDNFVSAESLYVYPSCSRISPPHCDAVQFGERLRGLDRHAG